jgi:hypothetical protein
MFLNILEKVLKEVQNLNENFEKWFSGSKVSNNGKPMVCYHGSSKSNIKSFDFSKIGSSSGNYGHYGYGIYFSTDIREAKTYGDNIYECYIKIVNPFTGSDKQILQLKNKGVKGIDELSVLSIDFKSLKNSFKQNKDIFEFLNNIEKYGYEKAWKLFSNFKNSDLVEKLNDISDIVRYTDLNDDVNGVPDYVLDLLSDFNVNPKLNKGFEYSQSLHWITDLGKRSEEVTEVIKELGYDGVIYGSEIIPFKPNQIKSINNVGTWDDNTNNIYK